MKSFLSTLNQIAFPNVCICCSRELYEDGRFICDVCLFERFDSPEAAEAEILPQSVEYLFTMWKFDKGGYLQHLMHKLKYDFLKGAGVETGRQLGRSFRQNSGFYSQYENGPAVVVPVPLHPRKMRKRGYNQAAALAEGFSRATGWPVIEDGVVVRVKNTKTQTGLSSAERSKNISNAFRITDSVKLAGRKAVIIDDVFTTGATTFELAALISQMNDESCGIVTVAKA